MKYNEGGYYSGTWLDDNKNGQGKRLYSNGDLFMGEFLNDEKKLGLMKYKNGDQFNGEFSNEVRSGKGVQLYVNKDKYKGTWLNDMRFGNGTLILAGTGQQLTGFWLNDNLTGSF
jgi:hypothetical protein